MTETIVSKKSLFIHLIRKLYFDIGIYISESRIVIALMLGAATFDERMTTERNVSLGQKQLDG